MRPFFCAQVSVALQGCHCIGSRCARTRASPYSGGPALNTEGEAELRKLAFFCQSKKVVSHKGSAGTAMDLHVGRHRKDCFKDAEAVDLSPPNADPLFVVTAVRK